MTVEQYIRFVLRFLKEHKVYYAYLYNVRKEILSRKEEGDFLDIPLNNYIEVMSQRLHQYNSMNGLFYNSSVGQNQEKGLNSGKR